VLTRSAVDQHRQIGRAPLPPGAAG
jgi:hypothetical protein